MAHHRSAIKRHIQSLKRRDLNRFFMSTMRTKIKRLKVLLTEGTKEQAWEALKDTTGYIQKVASKGIIHRNKSSRLVSRLSKHFHQKFEK